MTPAEVADLVERARAAGEEARRRSMVGGKHQRMSIVRVSAHFARFTGASFARSARAVAAISGFRVSTSGAQNAFWKIYGKRGAL
jgi:hypothetical protein